MYRQKMSKAVKLSKPGESELTNLTDQTSKSLLERGIDHVCLKEIAAFSK